MTGSDLSLDLDGDFSRGGVAGDPVAALYRRVAWRIAPFLCLGFLAAYVDRVNVGFAKLRMASDLGLGEAAYGLGAGLFFIGYVLCEVPSNVVLQRVGARFWLARIMLTWGLLSGAMCMVHTPMSFYVLRLLLGIAEAGFMPGALLYLSQWFPPDRRARVTALFMVGIPLSSVLGAPLSGFIMAHVSGVGGIAGWRWLFAIEALPPILLGVWALLFLPDSIERSAWLSGAERQFLRGRLREAHDDHAVSHLWAAFRDIRVWHLGLIDGSVLLGLYTVAFWFPSFLKGHGVHDPMTIGWITTIPHLVAVCCMILNGWHSDRSGERRLHIVLPIVAGAVLLACSTLADGSLALSVTLIALANGAILGALPPFWCIPANFLTGPAAAAGLAIACSFANLAGFFATALIGWTIERTHSPDLALDIFALSMGCAALSLFLIPRSVVDCGGNRSGA
ncbi:MFS transporter [Gluconacetobacter azotocaptans]|uniref:MFS transporter n=1 Tax=Gluconacetobacter azotocaptans TaxID=142834 RepID=UPI001957E00C|nr:MFS transporter [Gluconacetobacter azotocaptans]MBM9400310.1 MFS transporter [Gluconacetobacter azotocaptans]